MPAALQSISDPSGAASPSSERAAGLVIIGGGPAGLMAAEAARAAGVPVDLYDSKGSVGRKVLIAGKGGLNLTHSEPLPAFLARYGARRQEVGRWLAQFGPAAVREWARSLGVETFVGSSGRVFPSDLRAAPLLRGWVRRLREQGVAFHVQHRWTGWDAAGALCFDTTTGTLRVHADATVLALGGASWPELGSDGSWQPVLSARGVAVAPLEPSNCGFEVPWSTHLRERCAGAPLKPVVAYWNEGGLREQSLQGEALLTTHGIEGSLLYAISAALRVQLRDRGVAELWLDLAPGRDRARLETALAQPRGKRSIGEHVRRRAGLDAVKSALLFEVLPASAREHAGLLAGHIKRLPLRLTGTRPLAEAISSDGGVCFAALDDSGMLEAMPGVFCAGEMLDWDAPTGGYLLTACLASGRHCGQAAARWLQEHCP